LALVVVVSLMALTLFLRLLHQQLVGVGVLRVLLLVVVALVVAPMEAVAALGLELLGRVSVVQLVALEMDSKVVVVVVLLALVQEQQVVLVAHQA
jgi:hypothetical protein